MPDLANLVRVTSATVGTGTLTLGSAVTGFLTPSQAGMLDGQTYSYAIEADYVTVGDDLVPTSREVGEGIYASGAGTLTRATILNSTNSNAALNLTGDEQVIIAVTTESFFRYDNRIINPSGQIAQIGGAAGVTDGSYSGMDQWLVLTQTAAITTALFNVGSGNPWTIQLTQQQASAQRMGVIQWLESAECLDLRGQTVTLSAKVVMSASTNVRFAIVSWTGTADTITKDIVNDWTSSTYTAGNFFTSTSTVVEGVGSKALTGGTTSTIRLTVSALSTSMNNLAVFFWTESTAAQNATLHVWEAQLELGDTPSLFKRPDFHEELVRCKRYYQKSFKYATAPAQNVGTGTGEFMFPAHSAGAVAQRGPSFTLVPPMRVAPTVTLYNPAATNAQVRDESASADCSSSGSVPDETNIWLFTIGNASTAVGNRLQVHWTADARL